MRPKPGRGYGWPKQFLKQTKPEQPQISAFSSCCAGRLWFSVKGWFVSSLAARFLAAVACPELTGLCSLQREDTAEGEARISVSTAVCTEEAP